MSLCVSSPCRRLSQQLHTSTNSHLLPFQSVKTFVTASAAPPLCAEGHLSADACARARVCARLGVSERHRWVSGGLKKIACAAVLRDTSFILQLKTLINPPKHSLRLPL